MKDKKILMSSDEYMIHPTSDVQTSNIGKGTDIWQYVVVLPGAVIGDNCNINAHCLIENDVKIGNNVTIKCGVYLWNGITIEDNVQVGPNVTFVNDKYPKAKTPFKLMRTVVEKFASIGANCTIIGGITIGQYSLIGAGSVLTKSTPPYSLWYGNPAQPKGFNVTALPGAARFFNEEGELINKNDMG